MLDEATRHRRRKRQLENLEKDNFQEDPHASFAHLIGKHKLPTFSDSNEGTRVYATVFPSASVDVKLVSLLVLL